MAPPIETAAIEGEYRIGSGDVVRIDVYGESDMSAEWIVRSDGKIAFPHLGEVAVAGYSPGELVGALSGQLSEYFREPNVSVEVVEYRSQCVQVTGAVTTRGEFCIDGPTTLLEVISRAGYIDSETSVGEIRILHSSGQIERVTLTDLEQTGRNNLHIRSGDVIHVPQREVVYVGGEVLKPDAVHFYEGMTVIQALTHAGGPSKQAQLRGAYLLRNGERIPLNLRRILAGREADVSMQPGDQLFLKESPI